MPFDSVPWFVGGGAQHSPEVARTLAFAATHGAEGIVEARDFQVTETAVPGNTVRVRGGAALILNRAASGAKQTYVARLPQQDHVEIAPTSSAGGRSDLVVARVEDPFVSGEPWQDPDDPTVGPYVFLRVIPNVPAGTRRLQDVSGYEGQSAITLARIDIPASTGTITNDMITTNVRQLAQPRQSRTFITSPMPSGSDDLTEGHFVNWPAAPQPVTIPEWATEVAVKVDFQTGVTGEVQGDFRVEVGGTEIVSQVYDVFLPDGQGQRVSMYAAGRRRIASGEEGTTVNIRTQARRTVGEGNLMTLSSLPPVVYDVQFYEVPV